MTDGPEPMSVTSWRASGRSTRGDAPARGKGRRLAIVGAGWAGLAAAVRACDAGWSVSLFEMARHVGGRARSTGDDGLDNGQHILIGAYRHTLALMRRVGVDLEAALLRQPLRLQWPQGDGLHLPPGPALPAFARAVWQHGGWTARDKLALSGHALGWLARRFRLDDDTTVDDLCRNLPPAVRRRLIDPLCVAALNTAASEASARVFLRVLDDALFRGPGASDLLVPRQPLSRLLPYPALQWLARHGAGVELGHRVERIEHDGAHWRVDGMLCDAVVLACSSTEAARLSEPHAPAWAAAARSLRFEPIVTVFVDHPGLQLPAPMVGLDDGPAQPAQFVFDHGALGLHDGRFVFVISGAAAWVAAGRESTVQAVLDQAAQALAPLGWRAEQARAVASRTEHRATFRCTPDLARPHARVLPALPGLLAAGDYVAGPYPATLEGAVRSGHEAVALLPRNTG